MRDIIEEELKGPSVLKDVRALGFDFLPEELPGREEHLGQLARLFRPLVEGAVSQHVLITGPVGVGKTALARRFAADFARSAAARKVSVLAVHVNCRRYSTPSAALVEVLRQLRGDFPDRGFSVDEMLHSVRQKLQGSDTRLLVVLDEVNVLLTRSGPDLVYLLTRFNEGAKAAHHGVSLLLVSQGDVRSFLDDASASTLKTSQQLRLPKYTPEELERIARQRVGLAFHAGTVAPEVEELVADIAAESGSARLVIEVLEGAARAADIEHAPKVTAEHARAAKASLQSFVTEQKLRDLDAHKRLALLGIARALRGGEAFVVTGRAEENYRVACEEHGEEPRGHTQFWTYLNELAAAGLIDKKRSGKGQAGTTTLISLHDIPARALEERLAKLLGR